MYTGSLNTVALLNEQVEVLGSIVSSIAKTVRVNSVLDVGAGQVLIFLTFYYMF